MKLHMYWDAPLPLTLSAQVPLRTPRKNVISQLKGLLAVAVLVLFLFLPKSEKALAQETAPAYPGSAQNQYAPNQESEQQSDYSQQPEAQPYPNSDQTYPQQGYGQASAAAQPLNAAQLEQLVAPIALYPDALVAQVLAASTC